MLLNVSLNSLTNLTLPAAVDLEELELLGISKYQVTIRGLYMRQPILEGEGRVRVRVNGPSGRTVQVQRSSNLTDWEPWQTVGLGLYGAEILDAMSSEACRFFRVVGE